MGTTAILLTWIAAFGLPFGAAPSGVKIAGLEAVVTPASGTASCPYTEVNGVYFLCAPSGADDTLTIQTTLTAAGENSTIHFAAGDYKTTSTLRFQSGQRWYGVSGGQVNRGQTRIVFNGNQGPVVAPKSPQANTVNFVMEGVSLDGGNAASVVLDFTKTSYGRVRDGFVTSAARNGLGILLDGGVVGQCYFNVFDQVKVAVPYGTGIRLQNGANANQVRGGKYGGNGTGIELLSFSAANLFSAVDMEGNSLRHVFVDSPSNIFVGMHMEDAPLGYEITKNGNSTVRIATTYATTVKVPVRDDSRQGLALESLPGEENQLKLGNLDLHSDWNSQTSFVHINPRPATSNSNILFNLFDRVSTTGMAHFVIVKPDGTHQRQFLVDAGTGDVTARGRAFFEGGACSGSSQVCWTTGPRAPQGACSNGSMYTRTDAVGGLYVCVSSQWILK